MEHFATLSSIHRRRIQVKARRVTRVCHGRADYHHQTLLTILDEAVSIVTECTKATEQQALSVSSDDESNDISHEDATINADGTSDVKAKKKWMGDSNDVGYIIGPYQPTRFVTQ